MRTDGQTDGRKKASQYILASVHSVHLADIISCRSIKRLNVVCDQQAARVHASRRTACTYGTLTTTVSGSRVVLGSSLSATIVSAVDVVDGRLRRRSASVSIVH